jgi:alpha-L-fucosidase
MEIRTEKDIVHKLIEVVSKNGQLLLNLSPKSDGTFPENQKEVVTKIGRWLWTFGESIYETRPFVVFGEKTVGGQQVYFTRKGKNVYAIFLEWPGGNIDKLINDQEVSLKELNFKNLKGNVKSVKLLGLKGLEECPYKISDQQLAFTVKAKTRTPSEIAQVFRIELE